MAVGNPEVDASAPAPVVELAVIGAPWRAAVGKPRLADTIKYRGEFLVRDMESEVMACKIGVVIEQKRQRCVDLDWAKCSPEPV